ncbi:MAG TPA: hypothetical protein VGF22_02840 [Acidimicrobiales bacterium]|jgi:hypothetical protein
MGPAVTIEVTFVASAAASPEGVVRMSDESLRPFSGWIDLLAALEVVAAAVQPATRGASS